MNNKKRNILKLLIYIGIALILVGGSSFAYLTFFVEGEETNLVKSGCLQIDFSENNSLNLTNEVPKTDEEGKNGPNYTYTITNSCNLDAYYETTFNILQTSNSENDSKIKLYLTGDNYFEPRFVNSFKPVELDNSTSDIKTSYLIDSGYLKQGEVKNFNLRMWIDYDVTSFDGSFDSRIIVTSIADKGPNFDEKTTGYQVLGKTGVSSSTLVNPDYSKISLGTNQTSGLYKIQGIDDNYTYYFRGNPDNYFKFGKYSENVSVNYKDKNNTNVTVTHQKDDDILWRIVRINEDGSLRLILDDFIGISVFNTSLNTNYYNSSTIKEMIDNWYNTNLKNDYEKYLTNTNFCINKTYKMIDNVNYYSAYTRNITNHNPSLKCSESDLYISKIGLLSGDELALAGNLYNTKSDNNYLYKDTNGWYTLSPASLPNNELTNIVSKEGSSLDIEKVNTELSVRPVISIGSNYILKGNGTRENPYVIDSEFKKTNKLTIELDGGRYGNRTSAVFNLIAGEKLNLEIPVKDGYELSGWSLESGEGSSINGNTFVMGTTDALIKANWKSS